MARTPETVRLLHLIRREQGGYCIQRPLTSAFAPAVASLAAPLAETVTAAA